MIWPTCLTEAIVEGYIAGRLWTMVSLPRGLAETRRETLAVIDSQCRLMSMDGGVGAMAWLARWLRMRVGQVPWQFNVLPMGIPKYSACSGLAGKRGCRSWVYVPLGGLGS